MAMDELRREQLRAIEYGQPVEGPQLKANATFNEGYQTKQDLDCAAGAIVELARRLEAAEGRLAAVEGERAATAEPCSAVARLSVENRAFLEALGELRRRCVDRRSIPGDFFQMVMRVLDRGTDLVRLSIDPAVPNRVRMEPGKDLLEILEAMREQEIQSARP